MKQISIVGLILAFALLWAGTAAAGGWATVTVDALPETITAAQPFTIEFSVRQHGIRLMDDLSPLPTVTLVHGESGERVVVQAEAMARGGFFAATATVPMAGEWSWNIGAFSAEHPMPTLLVNDPCAGTNCVDAPSPQPLRWASFASLSIAAIAFVAWRRDPRPFPLFTMLATALLGLLALGYTILPAPANASSMAQSAIAETQQGEALFVQKGCIQCHRHDGVTMAENRFFFSGVDLTDYKASPDFLRLWLTDPTAVRPTAKMPNLELSTDEIETLITFLNG